MFRSVAEDPPLTEEPEMLQMSLLRQVFMGTQDADWNQISKLLGNPAASETILNTVATLIEFMQLSKHGHYPNSFLQIFEPRSLP